MLSPVHIERQSGMVQIEEVDGDEEPTVQTYGRVAQPTSSTSSSTGSRGASQRAASGERSYPSRPSPHGLPGFPMGPGITVITTEQIFHSGPAGANRSSSTRINGVPIGMMCPGTEIFEMSSNGRGGMNREVFAVSSSDGGADVIHIVTMPSAAPELAAKPRPPLVQTLDVPLEVLYSGGTLNCCVKSQAKNAFGPLEPMRVKYFDVEILPGYKHGTKIEFAKCFPDDEMYPGEPKVNVTFIVEEQKHGVFKRRNEHLSVDMKLTKEQLKAESFELSLKFLDGKTEKFSGSRGTCQHNSKRVFKGRGMPVRRNGQAVSNEFGDLTVQFVWPLSLRADPKHCCTVS